MALREEQILRYSRQILLREVGGRGQEALLRGGVRLEGALEGRALGAAAVSAVAWLAAGGTGVAASPGRLGPGAVGFLVDAQQVGQLASEVLPGALARLNEDALNEDALDDALEDAPEDAPRGAAPQPRGSARLAELPASGWEGEGPWVALGGEGAAGVVVFRGAAGCPQCFVTTVAGLGAPPEGALGVGLGALGALVLQRLLLGLGPALGACGWKAPGGLQEREVRRCGPCGG